MAVSHRQAQLLRAGVQLDALIPPRALDGANAELVKAGVPIDVAQLKPVQIRGARGAPRRDDRGIRGARRPGHRHQPPFAIHF